MKFNHYLVLAQLIFAGEKGQDLIRLHKTRVPKKSITLDIAIEEAHETLDIDPEEYYVPLSIDVWQEAMLDNPMMIVAMAKVLFTKLKKYGCYEFDQEPDWKKAAIQYIKYF